jgi:hypothetical protein
MSQEGNGFTVKDRRLFDQEGKPRQAQEHQTAGQEADQAPEDHSQAGQEQQGPEPRHLPPVDFGAFIFSLSHAAMMHLGHIPDPATGQTAPDPQMARHTIDTIAMLKEKTQGNLTPEEQRLIDHALSELRLAYVRQHG